MNLELNKIYQGDALEVLKTFPDEYVNCIVTSPPYFNLRDYQIEGQIGLEKIPEEYIQKLVNIFHEIKRILKKNGTIWINIGDSYNGSGKAGNNPEYAKRHTAFGKLLDKGYHGKPVRIKGLKPKDLIGIPWMLAFALRADGWWLRQDIIWSKINSMPESVIDRCTRSHEYIFLLSKSQKYYFNQNAIKEPAQNWGTRNRSNMRGGTTDPKLKHHGLKGKENEDNPERNKRSVWTIATKSYTESHFAVFPSELIEPCVKAGCPEGGVILDPFMGAGTTAIVAKKYNKKYIGIELNSEYIKIAEKRIKEKFPFKEGFNFKK